jgi:hypothetical protein
VTNRSQTPPCKRRRFRLPWCKRVRYWGKLHVEVAHRHISRISLLCPNPNLNIEEKTQTDLIRESKGSSLSVDNSVYLPIMQWQSWDHNTWTMF